LFLQASDLYDPEDVLDVIAESELWLEKAILYRKMGQENIVLQILALKLEDSEAAEQYCAEIGRDDAYIQLLGLYLDPQNGKEPMFTAAVRLLHNHGESLDPMQVLEVLLYYCIYTGRLFENLVACTVVCKRLLFWTLVF